MERFKVMENENRNLRAKVTDTENDNMKMKNDPIKITRKRDNNEATLKITENNVNEIRTE